MTCPDCDGHRGCWITEDGRVFRRKPADRAQWVPCFGCNGSGIASCCEGMCGGAYEVTNTGGRQDG